LNSSILKHHVVGHTYIWFTV